MFLKTRHSIKIIFVLAVVVVIGMLLRSDSVGTTFAASGIQLTIGSYSLYNGDFQSHQSWVLKDLVPSVDKFFNLQNILPGDQGVNVLSIQVEENPAYICLDLINVADKENGDNEPESHEDSTPAGELSEVVELFSWRDDGDGVFEVGEVPLFGTSSDSAIRALNNQTYPLADASTNEIFEEGVTYYVGIEWCFGNLDVDIDTAVITCDGELVGNEYQTDSVVFDVSLRAVEATFYTDYTCDPNVDLYLNKHISGVDLGFSLDQFSYHVRGSSTFGFEYIDEVVPHGETVELPVGVYTIEELVPDGFVKEDWRIGWYGQCESGSDYITTIEIEPRDVRLDILYCEADNQYRPENNTQSIVPSEEEIEEEVIIETEILNSVPSTQEWRVVDRSEKRFLDRLLERNVRSR